jgi:hypothetical protein
MSNRRLKSSEKEPNPSQSPFEKGKGLFGFHEKFGNER